MIPKSIHERGTLICRRLTEDVASIAPKGIGHWSKAWEIVASADADFMGALAAWESDPSSETAKKRVRNTYEAVLEAWRTATTEYQNQQGAER